MRYGLNGYGKLDICTSRNTKIYDIMLYRQVENKVSWNTYTKRVGPIIGRKVGEITIGNQQLKREALIYLVIEYIN